MTSPPKSLPIAVSAPDAPLPDEAIRAIASLLLAAVDIEDEAARPGDGRPRQMRHGVSRETHT